MSPVRLFWILAGLLILTYFGFNTVSPEIRKSLGIRKENLEVTGLENLIKESKEQLNEVQKAELQILEENHKANAGDSVNRVNWRTLSAFWTRVGDYAIAGAYLKNVAELEKSAASWAMAGLIFLKSLEIENSQKSKLYSQQMVLQCMDQALSLNPVAEPEYEMVKALAFVKFPQQEPMKGVRMLLDLEKRHPEFMPLQMELARLAIQTGQFEKAEARLLKVLANNSKMEEANCLMVKLLEKLERTEEIKKYIIHCKF